MLSSQSRRTLNVFLCMIQVSLPSPDEPVTASWSSPRWVVFTLLCTDQGDDDQTCLQTCLDSLVYKTKECFKDIRAISSLNNVPIKKLPPLRQLFRCCCGGLQPLTTSDGSVSSQMNYLVLFQSLSHTLKPKKQHKSGESVTQITQICLSSSPSVFIWSLFRNTLCVQ